MTPAPPVTDDPADRICAALWSGTLSEADLTARQLGAFLGKTTGHVYHRWGSLDGLLHDVGQAGFVRLGKHLTALAAKAGEAGSLAALAVGFVDFGLQHPALYALMFERRFDWSELRARGSVGPSSPGAGLFREMAARLGIEEARLLYAGLHGLVSLASSGRANVGALTQSDRDVARASARRLATLLSPAPKQEDRRDHHRQPASPRPARASEPHRKERDERTPRRQRRRAE